jgi:hypothetical protein
MLMEAYAKTHWAVPLDQPRHPIDMTRQGWSASLFHALQQ